MSHTEPKVTYSKDYTLPEFLIDAAHLYFDLAEEVTRVTTVLQVKRNPAAKDHTAPLVLFGENLKLIAVKVEGELLSPAQYKVTTDRLTIPQVPDHFHLETEVEIKPQDNFRLAGLYKSKGNFCTQCESQGFRHITYFLDRPDVLTHFTTTISADKKRYPVLLSNGNLIEEKEIADGRHWVKWEDPSLKPCYLFALVAGDFEELKDTFTTRSGRKVDLRLYVEKGKRAQADFALGALKRAMAWDEKTYDREYDLNRYMIVAVSDFNFGAMENKGLNIFNDKYILANPKTATDEDFMNIESVIGHEYFHNWSGNRVTVRDWFQITLKEGLTIFRDQNFSSDMTSAIVDRIDAVNVIRTAQFAQDAGPMSHPILPDSYIEINNFYTVTVYNKGAEVIRMIETMVGKEKFKAALNHYFSSNDGHAVTTEDFLQAMETALSLDLNQFRRWYHQAGTPVLDISDHYDPQQQTYSLTIKQSCPPTPGQAKKENFHIPLALGLLDSNSGEDILPEKTKILHIKNSSETFEFNNIKQRPIPSLLRNFSAPVKLNYLYNDQDLLFLLAHDSDGFNRWDAEKKLEEKILLQLVKDYQNKKPLSLNPDLIKSYRYIVNDTQLDPALVAEMLRLSSISSLIELTPTVDIDAIYQAREFVRNELARQLKPEFLRLYHQLSTNNAYRFDIAEIGRRSLKNLCLAYLLQLNEKESAALALKQFQAADNMTDEMGAVRALVNANCPERAKALAEFYQKWQGEELVIDKWFSIQALSSLPNTLETVKALLQHPAFDSKNPNRVRSLVGAFAAGNYLHFHAIDGSGYEFLADQILRANEFNPHLAARLIEPLTHWRKYDVQRQGLMKAQLERIGKAPKLSKDLFEIVEKSLNYGLNLISKQL